MPRKKLIRFAEVKKMKNILEFPENIKGKWSDFFGNSNPVTLELGCGKGEYTLGLAQNFPKRNFIGIDIQGERLWYGGKEAENKKISNVLFLRIPIEHLADYFKKNEVDEIWITFPDPHPKRASAKKRLTSPNFLMLYKKILKPKGFLYLKTDSEPLFDFSLGSFSENGFVIKKEERDIHGQQALGFIQTILTTYEKKYIRRGKPIFYCQCVKK